MEIANLEPATLVPKSDNSRQSERLSEIVKKLQQKHSGEEIHPMSCWQNGCKAACLMKVRVKDGVVTAIETDDSLNQGFGREDAYISEDVIKTEMVQLRGCVRGRGWRKEIYAPTILKYPMKRVGPKGLNAKFERISWDEALTIIAQKMKEMKEKYGPYSIGTFRGFKKVNWVPLGDHFGVGYRCWGLQSWPAHEFAELFVLGTDWNKNGPSGNHNPTFFDTKLMIFFGWDPLLNSHENIYYLILARDRGIPIIIIDPTYTWSAEVLADQWIPIRPGTDIAMILAMSYVLFTENLYDKEYVEKFIEPAGFHKWREYVLGNEDDVPKTPDWAEAICGVPAETIRGLARLYAKSKPCFLRLHWSTVRKHAGENNARAGIYLQAMTGNIGISGGCSSGVWENQKPILPLEHYSSALKIDTGTKPPKQRMPILCNANAEAKAVILREKLDKDEITLDEFNAEIGNPNPHLGTPNPKMHFMLMGNNAILNTMDSNERTEALLRSEFVVIGARHINQMNVWFADIVLPLVNQHFHDFKTYFDNDWGNYFIYGGKIVEPVGEARSPLWIETRLAAKLGLADQVHTKLQNVPDEKWDEAVETLYKEAYERWSGRKDVREVLTNPPRWDEVKRKGIVRIPNTKPFVAYRNNIEKGERFNTPSGKIEFFSEYLSHGPEHLAKNPYTDRLYGKAKLPPKAEYIMPSDGMLGSKVKQYPLYLMTPHSYFRQHSAQDLNPWLNYEYRHACWISLADAKVRGIRDNDLVRVFNDVGELILPAYVTPRVLPGTVIVRMGAWYQPSEEKSSRMPHGIDMRGNPNFLIRDDRDGGPVGIDWSTSLVEVSKWKGV